MSTKESLLNSAESAVRRRGYDGFSYADLAKEVGIRKASIHHHFPTKPDLALALIERYSAHFLAQLGQIAESERSGGGQLDAYIKTYREALQGGEMVCLCVAFSAGRDSLSAPVLAQLMKFHEQSLLWLKGVFVLGDQDGTIMGVDRPIAEAAACLAVVEGAQLMARASGTVELFDMAIAQIQSRIRLRF